MSEKQEILRMIQGHKAIEPFNYKMAVDWAIDLIKEGNETENVLMLASFTEPIEKHEISPYITSVLKDLGLKEIECDEALIAQTHFLLSKILKNKEIRGNLEQLCELCVSKNYDKRIMPFYLLHYAWNELDEFKVNFYYEGANSENIEEIVRKEATLWIDKYIYDIVNLDIQKELNEIKKLDTFTIKNLVSWSKKILK